MKNECTREETLEERTVLGKNHPNPKLVISSEEGEGEEKAPALPVKKKSDRPETTTDYHQKLAAEKKAAAEQEEQKEMHILDPLQKPSDKSKSYLDFLEEIREKEAEFKQRPIADLEVMAAEQTTVIYKIAVNSGMMKGTITKGVKHATAIICAAATTMAARAQNPIETPVEEQLTALRRQIQELRHKVQTLELLNRKLKKQKTPRDDWKTSSEEDNNKEIEEGLLPQRQRRGRRKRREENDEERDEERPAETPLLSVDRGVSPSQEGQGTSLPHYGGEVPSPLRRDEGNQDMEMVEIIPPIQPLVNKTTPVTDRQEEDRKKQENLMAMIEGIMERLLDRRLGAPPNTHDYWKETKVRGA